MERFLPVFRNAFQKKTDVGAVDGKRRCNAPGSRWQVVSHMWNAQSKNTLRLTISILRTPLLIATPLYRHMGYRIFFPLIANSSNRSYSHSARQLQRVFVFFVYANYQCLPAPARRLPKKPWNRRHLRNFRFFRCANTVFHSQRKFTICRGRACFSNCRAT